MDIFTLQLLWYETTVTHDYSGTDLSPTQIKHVPPNVRFEVDDFCSEWTYPENTFDLIHLRGLIGCAPDWPELYRQCYA